MSGAVHDLLGLTPAHLHETLLDFFEKRGQPGYRASQVIRWIQEGNVVSFQGMTDLPGGERAALAQSFRLGEPNVQTVSVSSDRTAKHLWRFGDDELVESVLIPAEDRLTLCLSSQAGCAMGCTFCGTGWGGFRRQLSAGEIVAQYRASRRWAEANGYGPISNIVYMGMGEPLANRSAVMDSLTILNQTYGVGARRITVSTVGLVPGILALAERPEQFRLALSLHAPESELRRELIPLEGRWPLPTVLDALRRFNQRAGRRITLEYTMIADVNDAPRLATDLASIARDVQAFVNLIPFNPIPFQPWVSSPPERVAHFREVLEEADVPVAVRTPRGRDIDAACGQLRVSALTQIGDTRGEKAGADANEADPA